MQPIHKHPAYLAFVEAGYLGNPFVDGPERTWNLSKGITVQTPCEDAQDTVSLAASGCLAQSEGQQE